MLKVFPENERVFRILRSFQSKFEIIITFFEWKKDVNDYYIRNLNFKKLIQR